ncbi:MAG: ABC transporter substrate-binding protein [Desulfatibacillaceae bacterium]
MRRVATKAMFVMMLVLFALAPAAQAIEMDLVIGLNIPKTGPYRTQGEDEEMGYKLAIESINEKGGVLGRKLTYILRDSKSQPALAAENTREMIQKYNAVMISGGVSSAVAIAQSDVCQELSVPFMAAITHSNATTGHLVTKAGFTQQAANRHTFRWYINAWMSGKTLAPYLMKHYGKTADYFYISADYTWGYSMEESLRWMTETEGSDTVGAVRTPLGATDFRQHLDKAAAMEPDILVLVLFGDDLVNALRQAHEMGLTKKTRVVVPLMEVHMAHALGHEIIQDVICTTGWYWGLRDRFEGTREFVNKFQTKYNKPPGSGAAAAWVAVHEWAAAVEKAGDVFADEEIILALEGRKFKLLKDSEEWRVWDHQCITEVFVMEGKSPKEAQGEWDLFDIVHSEKGLGIMRTREENPVTLQPLVLER